MAHKQCPHTDVSGWGIVEVVLGICEVGEDCDGLKAGCPFAYAKSRKATRAANRVYADFCKELERQPLLTLMS